MSKGRSWPAEWREYEDPRTGVSVTQLTDYKGHSHHLYFTNPGWYAEGKKLLFGSDRNNRTNLFSISLEAGEITQLTDLEPVAPPRETGFLVTCVNPSREEAYFWYDRSITVLDLNTLETKVLGEVPEGFVRSMINCTADGKYVCAGIFEDLSGRFRIDYGRGYIGFKETWEAHPTSRILRVSTDGGGAEVVWEEQTWIGHVNTSPTQPNLLTFCHEGPWHLVDNRIWGLDLETGKVWKIRPREGGERVGHEFWLTDGIHLGYHGSWPDGRTYFGKIRYDNTERIEAKVTFETGHIHSNDFELIAGDGGYGGMVVRLWRYNGREFEGPRMLAEHRGSFHIQQVHVHPRFTPDGRRVLYTSDCSGYGNVYLVDVPDFESLPEIEEGLK